MHGTFFNYIGLWLTNGPLLIFVVVGAYTCYLVESFLTLQKTKFDRFQILILNPILGHNLI